MFYLYKLYIVFFIFSYFNVLPRKKKGQALAILLLSECGVIVNCIELQFRT